MSDSVVSTAIESSEERALLLKSACVYGRRLGGGRSFKVVGQEWGLGDRTHGVRGPYP